MILFIKVGLISGDKKVLDVKLVMGAETPKNGTKNVFKYNNSSMIKSLLKKNFGTKIASNHFQSAALSVGVAGGF